jgi:hypothetical protein
VQFHFSPPFYTDLIKATSFIGTDRWSVPAALAYLDANSVAAGVMSVSSPGVEFLPPADAAALGRQQRLPQRLLARLPGSAMTWPFPPETTRSAPCAGCPT